MLSMTTSPGTFSKVTRLIFSQEVVAMLGGFSVATYVARRGSDVQLSKRVLQARIAKVFIFILASSVAGPADIRHGCVATLLVLATDCYDVCDGSFNGQSLIIERIALLEIAYYILSYLSAFSTYETYVIRDLTSGPNVKVVPLAKVLVACFIGSPGRL